MAGRRDALVAAARLVLATEAEASARTSAVATIGRIAVEPGGSNSIPGRASGTLDARAGTAAERDALVAAIAAAAPTATLATLAEDPGAEFDPGIRAALHAAAEQAGTDAADLPSFAGHDAGVLAGAGVPAGMLFVRSTTGVSHHPDEDATPADRALGLEVLRGTLAALLAR
jgi:N-carbamoyl-L-amino-acid hydrolase